MIFTHINREKREDIYTGISNGNGGCATKIACSRVFGMGLIVAVKGIRSMVLNGVRVEATATGLNCPAVSSM